MSRRRVAGKRPILPDPKFGSEVLTKFINVMMVDGKKSIAEKIIYGALTEAETRIQKTDLVNSLPKQDGLPSQVQLFQNVLDKIKPTVEVRSRRVGGATYQIPMEVKADRGVALAMRWLTQSSRGRNEKGMMLRLASEMLDALEGRGASMKKREDTHRMAEANKAFAHFRWN